MSAAVKDSPSPVPAKKSKPCMKTRWLMSSLCLMNVNVLSTPPEKKDITPVLSGSAVLLAALTGMTLNGIQQ